MFEQGRCTLTPDDSGRVLDRLAGLEQVISNESVRQALLATGLVGQRACKLTHEVMLWVVLAMGIFTDLPIRQVFKHARRLRVGEDSPHRSSLCVARQRLGVAPVRHLFQTTVRPLAPPDTPGAFYRGLRLVAIDGTVFDTPDTEANDKAFGRPSAGDRGMGAFPQVRKVSLVEVGTHVELAIVLKRIACGETTAMEGLWRHIPVSSLLLEDRGFFSYRQWKRALSENVAVLARVKSGLILKPLRNLSDGSYLAKIYPTSYDREKDRRGIVVRVMRYKLDDPQRVGHAEEHVLMTTLLDEELYPASELISLYHERWEEEMTFDEQKTHQDPRRATKPAHLRSETPAGVLQEMYALSLAHFVIRALMFEASEAIGLDSDRLSFTGCFQILKCRLPECDTRTPSSFQAWYGGLIWEMQQEKIEPRRNRINPRVIKRKMSKWKKKRPEHRPSPKPTKTFAETVVMIR
ncbi:MAG: IS4 family transposase [bacterium]|nr:IS4 family transposase [bacterium]